MKDDAIRARFDGRHRVELSLSHAPAETSRKIDEIAHALGYRQLAVEKLPFMGFRFVYERDDSPTARRRADLAVARLRGGGPLLPAMDTPPPPPPTAPPPAPAQPAARRPRRLPAEPPPPPPLAPPAHPRHHPDQPDADAPGT